MAGGLRAAAILTASAAFWERPPAQLCSPRRVTFRLRALRSALPKAEPGPALPFPSAPGGFPGARSAQDSGEAALPPGCGRSTAQPSGSPTPGGALGEAVEEPQRLPALGAAPAFGAQRRRSLNRATAVQLPPRGERSVFCRGHPAVRARRGAAPTAISADSPSSLGCTRRDAGDAVELLGLQRGCSSTRSSSGCGSAPPSSALIWGWGGVGGPSWRCRPPCRPAGGGRREKRGYGASRRD